MLLSTAYFPPVAWLSLAVRGASLEAHENYQKQSYRNRCYILGSGGPQMLQVPVVHGGSKLITDIEVDYSTPWVVRTQRALDTAYETSAFYEYYRDGVFGILDSQPRTLWVLNLSTIRFLVEKTGFPFKLSETADYVPSAQEDYRNLIHPKKASPFPERPYYQVFRDKLGGFTPGLSALDLLFNEGPGSIEWLVKQ